MKKEIKQQIDELELALKRLKSSYEEEEKEAYEKQEHKHFKEGDIVRKGQEVGIVGWTENKSCDCPYEAGYMGVNLITGSRGFSAFQKRDEWELVEDTYYRDVHKLEIELTGVELEDIIFALTYANQSNSTERLIKAIVEIKTK